MFILALGLFILGLVLPLNCSDFRISLLTMIFAVCTSFNLEIAKILVLIKLSSYSKDIE